MKKLSRMLCGLFIAFAVVVTGLQLTGVEAKAATTYSYNTWFKDYRTDIENRHTPQPISGSPILDSVRSFAVLDIISVEYCYDGSNKIPAGNTVNLYIYEKNVSTNELTEKWHGYRICGEPMQTITIDYIFSDAYDDINGAQIEYGRPTGSDSSSTVYEVSVIINVKPQASNEEAKEATQEIKESTHTHAFNWEIIQMGSPECDQIEQLVCSICGDKGETRTTSAYDIFVAEVNNELLIEDTPAGETAEITNKVFNVFSQSLMEDIASRRDIDVVFTYKYDGKNIQVTIPAGAEVDTSCEYYGPAKLMSLYGYKELPYFPGEIVASNIPELSDAEAGATVTLAGKPAYSKEDMFAIFERNDVNVDLEVTYDGKNYLIHIPAGSSIDLSCDWYGPAKLMSLYAYDEK